MVGLVGQLLGLSVHKMVRWFERSLVQRFTKRVTEWYASGAYIKVSVSNIPAKCAKESPGIHK